MIEARQYIKGQKITEPGVYIGVPMSVYHGPDLCDGPSISSSGLRTIFNASAAHYWLTSPYNPHRIEEPPKEAFILGRAAHHLLLGEADFAKHFIIRPDEIAGEKWHGNRKACKAWLAEQELAGLTVLTAGQVDSIRGMAASLAAHPLVQAGILNGLIECTICYRDKTTGIWIKVRPDAIPNNSADFADLKSTTSVSDSALERTIGDFAYPMQGALVGEACRQVIEIEMSTFSLVFVEKDAPNCCRVATLRPEDIELADKQNRTALKVFARGLQTGEWPGPGGTQVDAAYIGLPPWSRSRAENRIAQLEQEIAA